LLQGWLNPPPFLSTRAARKRALNAVSLSGMIVTRDRIIFPWRNIGRRFTRIAQHGCSCSLRMCVWKRIMLMSCCGAMLQDGHDAQFLTPWQSAGTV
jgi:hypothetical protein